jgi:hypothetical protein
MTNVIEVNFGPYHEQYCEDDDAELKNMAKSVLTYLSIAVEGKELCRYSQDLTLGNNQQYLLAWIKKYLKKYDGEEDVIRLLIPRLREYLSCLESYYDT